jgi:hypothetical protein
VSGRDFAEVAADRPHRRAAGRCVRSTPVSHPHQPPVPGQRPPGAPPAPLTVAAALVGVEALVLLGLGVAELASLSRERATMAVTTAFFFVGYGVFLGLCGWLLSRLRSWVRAPVVLAQLIQLLTAWSFREAPTTLIWIAASAVALVVLAGVLHPASLRALAED